MHGAIAFDQVEPKPDFETLPLVINLTTSRAGSIIQLLMLAPMMIMLAVPLSLLGAFASPDTTALEHLASHPLTALQIGAGLMIWVALFIWPLKRIVTRMGASRSIAIDGSNVTVVDKSPFGTITWSEPISGYVGVAHLIRASLSGNLHQLVMVHADTSKSLLIAVADRMPQATIDKAKALLNLPELPASGIYRAA